MFRTWQQLASQNIKFVVNFQHPGAYVLKYYEKKVMLVYYTNGISRNIHMYINPIARGIPMYGCI